MLTYWLMFLLPAMVALMKETQRTRALPGGESETPVGAWIAVGIVLTLLIGFRYEVGGDWFNYFFIPGRCGRGHAGRSLPDERSGVSVAQLAEP